MQQAAMSNFNPDPDRFAGALSPLVTDDLLRVIAALDSFNQEQHFDALKRMRDEEYAPRPLGFEPKEVLELGLHGPPYATGKVGLQNLTEHEGQICHAFIASSIMRHAMDFVPDPMLDHVLFATGHLLHLTTRLDALDSRGAASLCAWTLTKLPAHTEDLPFVAIALAKLSLDTNESDSTGATEELIQWAWAMETCDDDIRAFGRGMFQRDVMPNSWRKIGRQLGQLENTTLSERAQTLLNDIGDLISAGS